MTDYRREKKLGSCSSFIIPDHQSATRARLEFAADVCKKPPSGTQCCHGKGGVERTTV